MGKKFDDKQGKDNYMPVFPPRRPEKHPAHHNIFNDCMTVGFPLHNLNT